MKKQKIYTEVYEFIQPLQYWRGRPHTDSIRYVSATWDGYDLRHINGLTRLFDEVLTPHEYAENVDANTCADIIEDSIRVIVIYRAEKE